MIFNAFMVAPTFFGAYLDVGGVFSSFPSNSQVAVAVGSSIFKPIDVLMFGQPTFQSFGWSYRNWTYLNIFIPLTAIFALFFTPFRKRYSLYFLAILFISLFLAKGVNPPIGQIYVYLVMYSPSLVVGITRDVAPWLMLSALAYSFLIAMLVSGAFDKLLSNELWKNLKDPLREIVIAVSYGEHNSDIVIRKLKIPNSTILKLLAIFVVLMALVAALSTSESTLHSYTFVRYAPLNPPSPYFQAMRYFSNMSSNPTVMWLPNDGGFSWKGNYSYVIGPAGGNFYQNSVSSSQIHSYLYNNNTRQLGKVLSILGVNYLVYDSSGIVGYDGHLMNSSYITHFLSEQKDLKIVDKLGFLQIYKNEEEIQALYVGHPTLGSGSDSIFNSTHLLPGSNVYVNSSNIYRQVYNLGIMNYSRIAIPVNSELNFTLANGEQAYVVYSKIQTNYYFNSSMEQFNYTMSGNSIRVYLNYTFPSIVKGYEPANGTFDTGFGMVVQEYPDNGNFSSILANGIFPKQLNHSTIGGEVVFTVPKIDSSSLYYFFYLGSFNLVTPLYYLFSTIGNTIKQVPLPDMVTPKYSLMNESRNYLLGPSYFVSSLPHILNGTLVYNASIFRPVEAFIGKNLVSNSTINDIQLSNIYVKLTANGKNFSNQGEPLSFNQSDGYYAVTGSTPIQGTYTLNIKVYSGYVGFQNRTLSSGVYNFSADVDRTILINIDAINSTFSISLYKLDSLGRISYSFSQKNPVSYTVRYSSQTPILVVLPVSYSSGWLAYIGKTVIRPVPLDGGIATGFILPSGNRTISISFVLQAYLYMGFAITALAYGFLVGIALHEFASSKKRMHLKFILLSAK